MKLLKNLPELGVGFIYWPTLDGLATRPGQPVDVVELEPQPFWFDPNPGSNDYILDSKVFDRLRALPQHKLIHGVGFPIGGTVAPDQNQVSAFVKSIRTLRSPWASEHLSFSKIREGASSIDAGFLLPPVQSEQGVAVAVANIQSLQERLPVPFAFETGVNYLQPLPSELPDGEFFSSIAEQSDCGIVLDLHNVWANELNGRQPVIELVQNLPLDRVIEVHLAGGQDYEGYWVDAHSGLIQQELLNIAKDVIPRLPNLKALIFEVMPQYVISNSVSLSQLTDQFWQLRELWDTRGSNLEGPKAVSGSILTSSEGMRQSMLPSPEEWEEILGAEVSLRRPSRLELKAGLHSDGGTAIMRRLIGAARAGRLADTLALTTRLLLLTIGEKPFEEVLTDFWHSKPPEEMTSNEARQFVDFVKERLPDVLYLTDVTNFELAAHRSVMTGQSQKISTSVDPQKLFSALRDGKLPVDLSSGHFLLTVAPPAE